MTQSYFEDIDLHLTSALMQARLSVRAAVAWCTDPNIIRALAVLQKKGVSVELIVNDDKINRKIDYSSIISNGGKIYYADGSSDIMHNKFCIIDSISVVSGSYNWTSHAKANDEQITIISDDQEEVNRYNDKFNFLLYRIEEKTRTAVAPNKKDANRITRSSVTINIEDITINKDVRFNRSFTLSAETDKQLNAAAAQLGMAKSAIIEKAFSAWWDAVQKMTNK